METRSLKEITREESIALMAIVLYWQTYDTTTVLLTLAELKRRNVDLNDNMRSHIKAFCAAQQAQNFEPLILSALRKLGYYSYEEYYNDQIAEPQRYAEKFKAQGRPAMVQQPLPQSSSLRLLRKLYTLLGWLAVGATFMSAYTFGKLSLAAALITLVVGAIVVLGVFALAEFMSVLAKIEQRLQLKG